MPLICMLPLKDTTYRHLMCTVLLSVFGCKGREPQYLYQGLSDHILGTHPVAFATATATAAAAAAAATSTSVSA